MYSLSEKSCMKGKILVVINQIQLRLQTETVVCTQVKWTRFKINFRANYWSDYQWQCKILMIDILQSGNWSPECPLATKHLQKVIKMQTITLLINSFTYSTCSLGGCSSKKSAVLKHRSVGNTERVVGGVVVFPTRKNISQIKAVCVLSCDCRDTSWHAMLHNAKHTVMSSQLCFWRLCMQISSKNIRVPVNQMFG